MENSLIIIEINVIDPRYLRAEKEIEETNIDIDKTHENVQKHLNSIKKYINTL